MLREVLIGEAMHALGIPTTRALAVVATGEPVVRDTLLPGAVLARVAASHLRVGTFQYAAARGDLEQAAASWPTTPSPPPPGGGRGPDNARPGAAASGGGRQASLVARWMLVGFIHGVMNTDNMTISGETIDYGPCAFMDGYDPATVFSSIDHGGRYAYGNQPSVIARWNLARLAETLLPLIDDDEDTAVAVATEVLQRFPGHLAAAHEPGMRAKLGLDPHDEQAGDPALAADLLGLLREQRVDLTSAFRSLSSAARGDLDPFRRLFAEPDPVDAWLVRWYGRIGPDRDAVAAAMDAVNPVYIARNHLVEEALAAGTDGDLAPVERLLDVLADPFRERPGLERYAEPAPAAFGPYRTFCGT
jgi:uncharacterized protein YdiU (UPF0061 family)